MRPLDTSEEAHRVQRDIWRKMTPTEKFRIVVDLSELVRECAKTRIRKEHPELTEEEVHRRLIFEMYGV